jgi:hypothetical protein
MQWNPHGYNSIEQRQTGLLTQYPWTMPGRPGSRAALQHSWTILATLSGRVCTCLPHSTQPLHMLLNATQVELSSSSVDK